ncbi:hypothetical protein [Micromonospora sp. NPDC004551]|uniref:hypothetical protein n=1 Tax=Micromonospora sp. NPDC004551 TaxID=3154284 RepID=UPI0033AC9C90
MGDIDWGDAGGWAQAIGNFALWLIAVITLLRDRKRITALEREAAENREEQKRAQARLVSAWPDEWSAGRVAGRCLNASSEPIYRVVVRVFNEGARPAEPPTRAHRRTTSIPLMRPKEELPFVVADGGPAGQANAVAVDLAFVDAAGHMWWRQGDGTLFKQG